MKTLIKNGTVVNPLGKHGALDILIEDDKIAKIGKDLKETADRTIDATGLHVLPGLVDMHVHLREPGYEYKETILSGTKAAVKGGITAVACMPNTKPVLDSAALIEFVIKRAKQAGYAKVYPVGSISKGLKGEELAEMGDMKLSGAIAFSDDGHPVMDSNLMRNALMYAKNWDALLISHCEDLDLVAGGVMNEGYMSTILGLKGNTRAAEETHVAREIILAQALNTKIHIAHVSTRGGTQMIREAKARGVKVTAETAPHYFCATDEFIKEYDTNAKVNPPLRCDDDKQAIIQGIADGTLDCLITDHAPHHKDEKNVEFNNALNGISGLETSFALTYSHLVKPGHITLDKLVYIMSINPNHVLQLDGGLIEKGKIADITIVDLEKTWTPTLETWVSQGKNSPFMGMEMTGQAVYTIVDGKVLLDNGIIVE